MRSVPKVDIREACSGPMVANDPLIVLLEVKGTTVADIGVSASQQLVLVVLGTPGYNYKEMTDFIHGHLAPKLQLERSWNVAIAIKHRTVGLRFQSMRRHSLEKVGAHMGIRIERARHMCDRTR